jgi:hypothetical protein
MSTMVEAVKELPKARVDATSLVLIRDRALTGLLVWRLDHLSSTRPGLVNRSFSIRLVQVQAVLSSEAGPTAECCM